MTTMRLLALGAVMAGFTACGGRTTTAGAAPDAGRWSGRFSGSSMIQSGVLGATAGGKNYGDVSLRPSAAQPGRVRYELALTVPMLANRQVAWAIYTGRCDMTSMPVAAATSFPPLDVAINGVARLRGEMALTLDPRGEYHVDLYRGPRASESAPVAMCANLRFDGKR